MTEIWRIFYRHLFAERVGVIEWCHIVKFGCKILLTICEHSIPFIPIFNLAWACFYSFNRTVGNFVGSRDVLRRKRNLLKISTPLPLLKKPLNYIVSLHVLLRNEIFTNLVIHRQQNLEFRHIFIFFWECEEHHP